MQKTISYEPFCVDGYLIVPQEEKKITSVYNILDGAPVLSSHVEICALPKRFSLRGGFNRQVFDILNKSGLYRSENSLRNSFYAPFENGKPSDKADSSVLLRLTTAHFVQYLLNSKKGEIVGLYLQDFSYDWPEYKAFQLDNIKIVGGIPEFEQEIKDHVEWKQRMRKFAKFWEHIK